MKSIAVGAVGAAIVFAAVWIGGLLVLQSVVLSEIDNEGPGRSFAGVVGIPMMLGLFVAAPLAAGLAGGLLTGRLIYAVGSLVGVLVATALIVGMLSVGTTGGAAASAGILGVTGALVVGGHAAGALLRPRRVPV